MIAASQRCWKPRPLQPREFVAGEDRDGLVGDAGRLQPGHRVRDLLLDGQPPEELLQRPTAPRRCTFRPNTGGVIAVIAALSSERAYASSNSPTSTRPVAIF
jgi:hypothetical protein